MIEPPHRRDALLNHRHDPAQRHDRHGEMRDHHAELQEFADGHAMQNHVAPAEPENQQFHQRKDEQEKRPQKPPRFDEPHLAADVFLIERLEALRFDVFQRVELERRDARNDLPDAVVDCADMLLRLLMQRPQARHDAENHQGNR